MTTGSVWVFHAGALGDFVLTWPLMRAVRRATRELTVVADSSKARLCATVLGPGVHAEDGQKSKYTRLWMGRVLDEANAHTDVERVYTFVSDGTTEAGARWTTAAGAMFPNARIVPVGPPGSATRERAWSDARVHALGGAAPISNPRGPIITHVGAGSDQKRWPMPRWSDLVRCLRADISARCANEPAPVIVLAGEVEAERFTRDDHRLFDQIGGRMCTNTLDLAELLREASLVIGADTGPTHLAAQLGVPTLALFGPTDPSVWAPVGPSVRVIAPDRGVPAPMEWLRIGRVLKEARLTHPQV